MKDALKIAIGLATMFGVFVFFGLGATIIRFSVESESMGLDTARILAIVWLIALIATEIFVWKKVVNPKVIKENEK